MKVVETSTHYYLDDVPYLRVTTLIKTLFQDPEYKVGAIAWAQYNEATRLGKQIDKLITQDLSHCYPCGIKWPKNITTELTTLWEAYQESKKLFPQEPVAVQELVWSEHLQLAGRIDRTEPDGVTDYKGTAKILERHWLQTNTYLWLKWKNQAPGKMRHIIRLDKVSGMSEIKTRVFSPNGMDAIRHLRAAYRMLYEKEESHVALHQ